MSKRKDDAAGDEPVEAIEPQPGHTVFDETTGEHRPLKEGETVIEGRVNPKPAGEDLKGTV